jgi:methionine-rich copper-binding protein CopC
MTIRLPLALAASLMFGLALASPVLAHAELLSEVPAANAKLSAPLPTALTLTFSEALELSFTKIVVKGPDGTALDTGAPALSPDGKSVTLKLSQTPLPEGKVTIEWTAVATDGHKTKGSYSFSVAN